MFSPAQLASCLNVNHVVYSYHLPKLFFIDIIKAIKINGSHDSRHGYGLLRDQVASVSSVLKNL